MRAGLVSICTPTFNRRPFIPMLISCVESQDYPHIEWIIIDDGTDKIEDLVAHLPYVKYYKYSKRMPLGKKRNMMHKKSRGKIIVYMDDDDFYPPSRVSHAVERLTSSPDALCAGSSEMYIYYKNIKKMYQFGPYGDNHATAATFAFRRELLEITRYDETALVGEEKYFLKDYTIPFVQLDPLKTILVFSHIHNSCSKEKLIEAPSPKIKLSNKCLADFNVPEDVEDFFINRIDECLTAYPEGSPVSKPEVMEEMAKRMQKMDDINRYNKLTRRVPDDTAV